MPRMTLEEYDYAHRHDDRNRRINRIALFFLFLGLAVICGYLIGAFLF